jgi:hypothetical protein
MPPSHTESLASRISAQLGLRALRSRKYTRPTSEHFGQTDENSHWHLHRAYERRERRKARNRIIRRRQRMLLGQMNLES